MRTNDRETAPGRSILIVSNWERDDCFIHLFFFLSLLNLVIAVAIGNAKSIYLLGNLITRRAKFEILLFIRLRKLRNRFFTVQYLLVRSTTRGRKKRTRSNRRLITRYNRSLCVNFSTLQRSISHLCIYHSSSYGESPLARIPFRELVLYRRGTAREKNRRSTSLPCPSKLRKKREKERNLVIYIVIRVSFRTLSTGLKINTPPSPSVRRCFHYPVILFTCFQFPGQLIRRSPVKRDLPHRGLVWPRRVSVLRGSSCNREMIHAHAFPPNWN